MKQIEIFKLDEKATVPTRNHAVDAGLDLYALEDTIIPVGQTVLVKTGIAARIPEGYVGLLRERSSIGKRGLKVAGGVIDAGYSGDISILLMNISAETEVIGMTGVYRVKAGDRVAQLMLLPVITPEPVLVDKIWDSSRGSKGFGSSGN